MHQTLQASITELESLPALQERIDRVAEDLLSGERRYADIDTRELGELLGLKFGSCEGWGIGRGWASFLLGPIAWLGSLGILGAAGYYRYKRTVIFGEVALEYIKNDCSWGGEDPETVIKMCQERALQHYMKLTVSMDA